MPDPTPPPHAAIERAAAEYAEARKTERPTARKDVARARYGYALEELTPEEILALVAAAREGEQAKREIDYLTRAFDEMSRKCRHYENAVCFDATTAFRLHQDGATTKEIDAKKLGDLFRELSEARAALARLRREQERLHAVIRETHIEHCEPAWNEGLRHAPGCKLYEIDDHDAPAVARAQAGGKT